MAIGPSITQNGWRDYTGSIGLVPFSTVVLLNVGRRLEKGWQDALLSVLPYLALVVILAASAKPIVRSKRRRRSEPGRIRCFHLDAGGIALDTKFGSSATQWSEVLRARENAGQFELYWTAPRDVATEIPTTGISDAALSQARALLTQHLGSRFRSTVTS
jgi:hypothetical protein